MSQNNNERAQVVEVIEEYDGDFDLVIFDRAPDGIIEPNYDQQGNPIYIDIPIYFYIEGELKF